MVFVEVRPSTAICRRGESLVIITVRSAGAGMRSGHDTTMVSTASDDSAAARATRARALLHRSRQSDCEEIAIDWRVTKTKRAAAEASHVAAGGSAGGSGCTGGSAGVGGAGSGGNGAPAGGGAGGGGAVIGAEGKPEVKERTWKNLRTKPTRNLLDSFEPDGPGCIKLLNEHGQRSR